jgi:hypothetical protein
MALCATPRDLLCLKGIEPVGVADSESCGTTLGDGFNDLLMRSIEIRCQLKTCCRALETVHAKVWAKGKRGEGGSP